jgi:transcriptional regulator GlxA family with amidase domain
VNRANPTARLAPDVAEIVINRSLRPKAFASTMTVVNSVSSRPARTVVVVAFPGVMGLDVVGPLDVFASASGFGADPGYATTLVSSAGGPVSTSSGLELLTQPVPDLGPIDTLVVAGGPGTVDALADAGLRAWLRHAAARARRVTSVCSGAFLLAGAGLLDGRRATTHWSVCDTLAALFPQVEVEPDRIFVRDGHVWTSAGVTAGIDLALALVEHDHGGELALRVARELVVFAQRPGGQSQFSTQLVVRRATSEPLRDLLAYVAEHPEADLSVPALAERASMSVRSFARNFRHEVGTTPAAFVQQARVEAARRLLETTDRSVDDVAQACGFGTVETMHRTFRRTVHTTPGQYRRLFAVPA